MTHKKEEKENSGQMSRASALTLRDKAADKVLDRFNALNALIVHGVPEIARAYDALHRHLPLLREMQDLLSQRPVGHGNRGFTMLQRERGKTIRATLLAETPDQIPTWSQYLAAYAHALDYSVRHIRRLVLGEMPVKTKKECGWTVRDHNHLIRAATGGSFTASDAPAHAQIFSS